MTSSLFDKAMHAGTFSKPAKHRIIKRVIYGCFE